MPEYEGFKIVYEVIALPKGRWGIMIEIVRRESGEVLIARHNPFPQQPFDTKLQALDQVNRYIEETLEDLDGQVRLRRIA
ncbi:hypothetical protein [Cupriavidus sp. RAF12]|uniref:hypothetical protein n=1 Tax=Cupriavidus sp. RAF12 TaxID=3233050 RepID=UPI003F8FEDDE